MKKYAVLTLLTTMIILCTGCGKDITSNEFCEAVSSEEINTLRQFIDDKLDNLNAPVTTTDDAIGHEKNLIKFVDQLNEESSCMTANIFCYACVKTNPSQSEILINIIDEGISKIIDISTQEGTDMSFASIHNP